MVDYQYPLNFAQFGKEIGIQHFGLLTSAGSSATSWFFYMKTKGQVENAVKALDFPQLTIFQPALLLNRRNDSRTGEKIASYIPFLPSIEAKDLGEAILKAAWAVKLGQSNTEMKDWEKIAVMGNSDIKEFWKTSEEDWCAK